MRDEIAYVAPHLKSAPSSSFVATNDAPTHHNVIITNIFFCFFRRVFFCLPVVLSFAILFTFKFALLVKSVSRGHFFRQPVNFIELQSVSQSLLLYVS